jgi:hypothetical protein
MNPEKHEHASHHIERSARHDAYFCVEHRVWLEDTCGDPTCFYCKDRPTVPEGSEE